MLKTHLDEFKGILVAIYACYDENGEVSVEDMEALARFYAEKGVKGLYVGGSSGEGILQSVQERQTIMRAIKNAVGDELTVIAHIGAPATRDSMVLAQYAESIGIDAVSAVPSIYYGLSEQAVENHWQSIIDSTSLPFIMYHIPATTGFHLSVSLLQRMAEKPKVIGVKVSSASSYELHQFKQAGGDDFIVYNGSDEQLLAGLSMGADGGIGGTYGVMPELYLALHRCYTEEKLQAAQQWQTIISDIIGDILATGKLNAVVKEITRLRGYDCGAPRMPLEPLAPSDLSTVKMIHAKIMKAIDHVESNHE